ncbi:uncharacterized protein LOC134705315 [Mytilus trossulus]|uniref:uncharacterized protein LOC134705315 n=1 Tax=Mytilus trossulus TaxID=6551 RepID=UPI003006CD54
MASSLNSSDKTKVDKQSLHNETTAENSVSQEGDKEQLSDDNLLPPIEPEDDSVRNESSPCTVLLNALANCRPAAVPLYMKYLVIGFIVVVILIIATVCITISIVKKPCQERPLPEAIRRGSVVEDLHILLSIWDDKMDKLNITFFGKNDHILIYQINYQGNGARNQIVLCQQGESAFSISCGEEKTNACVPVPEYPNKNPETFPKHFNYVIDRQCIGKKADLRWKT